MSDTHVEQTVRAAVATSTVPALLPAAETPPPSSPPAQPISAMARLQAAVDEHPLWTNPLLRACQAGHLTLDDCRYVFAQYACYSRQFTRYLAALMTNCENDFFRAKLAENLWEEGGGQAPEKRHAEIFRQFLRQGLGLDVEAIVYLDGSRQFAQEYLSFCVNASPAAGAAFLSLGTEAIVGRLYEVFLVGLQKAGVADEHLAFFHIHIGCDDEHAATLADMMLSYADEPGWFDTSLRALQHALDLRHRYFLSLHEGLQKGRLQGLLDGIQTRQSLAPPMPVAERFVHRPAQSGVPLYQNQNERLNISFAVERLPFKGEVLDPRVVRIPPGRVNEKHRHAHETLFYIVAGTGRVLLNATAIEVAAGDIVFVPRWAMHQSQNTGAGELVILAVTDFGLTGKAYIGDYLKTARLGRASGEPAPAGEATGATP